MSFIHDDDQSSSIAVEVRNIVRAYVVGDLLLGIDAERADAASFIEAGVLDSTGAMELVGFLEQAFSISIADAEIVPENLDSLEGIVGFVVRKLKTTNDPVA